MQLFSRRFEQSTDGKASIARLYIELIYECFILEDTVREPKIRPADPAQLELWVKGWKIPGKTAIPSGSYPILWTKSARFSLRAGHDVFTLEIQNVPGFSGIRFHSGSYPEDTEGCQLPGRIHVSGSSFVGESKMALAALEAKVCPVLRSGEEVWISISNEFPDFFAPGNTLTGQ